MKTVGELNLTITNLFVILLGAFPYAACIITKIKKLPSTKIETAGVCFDKFGNYLLLYNPIFLNNLTVPQALGLLQHESKHILFRHLTRFPLPKSDLKLADLINRGLDIAINQDIEVLPPGGIYPETYGLPRGKSADYYIEALKKIEKDIQSDSTSESSGDKSDQKDNNSEQLIKGMDDHNIWDKVYEETSDKLKDAKELGIDSERKTKKMMETIISDLDKLQKVIGSKHPVPDSIRKEMELKPEVKRHNWRHELNKEVNKRLDGVESKLTYKKTNRRYSHLPYVLPGKRPKKIPKIFLIRDTSYSCVVEGIQDLFLNEMIQISNYGELYVADCDTDIRQFYKVRKKKDFKSYVGRGATSFVPAFEKAKKLKPDIIIYLTDLEGEFPTKDIKCFDKKTIWVTFNGESKQTVPFGKIINILT